MPPFRLSKWYLDCVTDAGNTSIAYVGDLDWGPIHFYFSSLLHSTGSEVKQQNSLRKPALPAISGDELSWGSTRFDFSAAWHSLSIELCQTIFKNAEGCVVWRCLMPLARVRTGNDSGLGYVECLTMTIAPWKIPIKNLRWGRFCSYSDWIVWIDWRGEFSKCIVYLNGERVPCATIEDGQITFENESRLALDRSLTLRKGTLGSNALSSIPGVSKTFPARLLQVSECKWRSRARLERPGRAPVEGWAIHEIVSWPE